MNLQPVTPVPPEGTQQADCIGCKHRYDMHTMFADLEGEPFKAYYCITCAANHMGTTISAAMDKVWDLDPKAVCVTQPIKYDRSNQFDQYRGERYAK